MQVLRRDLPARCVKSVLPIDFVPKPSPQLWISFVQRTISNVTVRRNPQNQASLTDANRSTKDEPCSAYSSLDHLHRLQSVNNSVMPTQLSGSRRFSSIYEDFDVFSGAKTGRVLIDGYDDTGFILNGVRHEGSLICLGKLVFKWTPRKPSEITPESLSLFELLRPPPELLILGNGKRITPARPEVRAYLKKNGIKLEAIDTKNAASTFNFLNEEGRQVAVAMLSQNSTDNS
ncbi:NADH dehydrogenase [ubiquinone] 1 alpha subcomplex assembly factor 3 [Marchantia polymorpha subsp. ruderalis]|uniref:NADH dehydrogenase [ubiquinone] 1 alpha subcomplex assembly factor 3 n=2 Tax=Marchantia polymorpha TaxID=3197 RepID=A0AAF6AQE9_MARPO|nr:hypothetical protein MARPO_0033s0133 [Marchantia polymorpha]BBM98669.1 hypothetical protein Mp_1g15280 [Marchantia polymorpha subsp. ruderalis]|eukprot:PTQ41739.1 hypothetical protein MARPO_0033s0133 [Marchantia polymorpha]